MQNKNTQKPIYAITESAVLVGIALAVSFIKIPLAAFGGSVDFVMIPLFIICYRRGVFYGTLSGLCFGFLKCIIGGALGWGLPSVLLDYVLAYGAIGLAGIFKGKKNYIEISALVGCAARFCIHFISGITIYKILVPTVIEGVPVAISSPYIYSLIYNLIYMLPNTVIACIGMALLRVPLEKLK